MSENKVFNIQSRASQIRVRRLTYDKPLLS